MTKHSTNSHWNAVEQYSSKTHHLAQELSLNTCLVNNIMRLTHSNGAICLNDAKNCYDRISHSILVLALWRIGISQLVVKSLMQVFHWICHYICTGYGNLLFWYVGDWLCPLQGVLQGNGAVPAIWAAVSTPLIWVLQSRNFGFSSISPITSKTLWIVNFSFVDDTNWIRRGWRVYYRTSFSTILEQGRVHCRRKLPTVSGLSAYP